MKKIYITLIFIFIETTLFSQAGILDSTFAEVGFVTTDPSGMGYGSSCNSVEVLNDGSILACGYSTINLTPYTRAVVLVKYTADGDLDSSFGVSGIGFFSFPGILLTANGMALHGSGKILVCGQEPDGNSFIVRFNFNGTVDSTFGDYGISFPFSLTETIIFRKIAIQNDGKILVAGDIINPEATTWSDLMIARINFDGTPDSSFAGTGYTCIDGFSDIDHANGLAIQNDGKIIVGGTGFKTGSDDIMITRLNTDGTPDILFGFSGKNLIDLKAVGKSDDYASDLILQDDGKIILVGYTVQEDGASPDYAILRLYATGFLDTSFGVDGIVIINDYCSYVLNSVAIQTDGKILGVGWEDCAPYSPGLIRLNANGSVDSTFGENGSAIITEYGPAFSVDIQENNKIVIAGNSNIFSIARFLNDNPPCSTAPTGLSADFLTSSTAKLHWSADPDAIKYKIQYRKNTVTTWTNTSATSNVKNLFSLESSTTYKYRVKTNCGAGVLSDWSSVATFTTLPLREGEEPGFSDDMLLSVYPNPSSGNFTLKFDDVLQDQLVTISIKNLLG
ncbi:MAG: fibronectin type III domain-containing protein, partial [Chitinophagales bacterium]